MKKFLLNFGFNFQDFYLYAGFDCTSKWSTYLGDAPRRKVMILRLQEAFGVEDEEIQACRDRLARDEWTLLHVAKALEYCLLGDHAHALHTVCPMSSVLEWPVAGPMARLSTPHALSSRRPPAWRPTGLAHCTLSALNGAPPRDRPALTPLRPDCPCWPALRQELSPLSHLGPASFPPG